MNGPNNNSTKGNNIMRNIIGYGDDAATKREIVRAIVKKYRVAFLAIVLLISLFEIIMFVRGLMTFDMTDIRRKLYMLSYILLFLFSVTGAILLIQSIRKNNVSDFLVASVYTYCVFLSLWATLISCLDVLGRNTPIVFMTVIMATAALAFLRPYIYCVFAGLLSVIMAGFCHTYGNEIVSRSGFLINFVIYVIITFFIAYRQYGQNRQDYMMVKRLENLSYHDQLTGAYNRQYLHEKLEKMSGVFYFGIFDLDNFKDINDSYGHEFGDECLVKMSDLLHRYYGDLVFRFGGDEFIVVSDMRKDDIITHGADINRELKELYPDRHVQISGGFYCPRSQEETYNDFLKNADEALYRAKNNGKGRIEVFGDDNS